MLALEPFDPTGQALFYVAGAVLVVLAAFGVDAKHFSLGWAGVACFAIVLAWNAVAAL